MAIRISRASVSGEGKELYAQLRIIAVAMADEVAGLDAEAPGLPPSARA